MTCRNFLSQHFLFNYRPLVEPKLARSLTHPSPNSATPMPDLFSELLAAAIICPSFSPSPHEQRFTEPLSATRREVNKSHSYNKKTKTTSELSKSAGRKCKNCAVGRCASFRGGISQSVVHHGDCVAVVVDGASRTFACTCGGNDVLPTRRDALLPRGLIYDGQDLNFPDQYEQLSARSLQASGSLHSYPIPETLPEMRTANDAVSTFHHVSIGALVPVAQSTMVVKKGALRALGCDTAAPRCTGAYRFSVLHLESAETTRGERCFHG